MLFCVVYTAKHHIYTAKSGLVGIITALFCNSLEMDFTL